MTWSSFPFFVAGAGLCWLAAFSIGRRQAGLWVLAGTVLVGVFIAGLWVELARPPMRTLGETRLWFGVLLPMCGLLVFLFVPWRWPLAYASSVAFLFLLITVLRPETHDRTLMPALQSIWFVPHVVLYMIAYAFLVYAAVLAGAGWWRSRREPGPAVPCLVLAEVGLWIGFGFLTLGLLAGAVWAKEAWGHYWTWDPKETWAFLTWAVYLVYFHLRSEWQTRPRAALLYLCLASTVVFLTWFGVNYLPSAASSVHTYSS